MFLQLCSCVPFPKMVMRNPNSSLKSGFVIAFAIPIYICMTLLVPNPQMDVIIVACAIHRN